MKEILVPLTNTPGDDGAVDFAAKLARRSEGRLVLALPVELPLPSLGPWGDGPIAQMQAPATTALGHAHDKANAIRRKLATLDVPYSVEIEDGRSEAPFQEIAKRAQISDCCVMACAGKSASERRHQHSIFSVLIFESGRPAFAIPTSDIRPESVRHAIVAWSPTHESARAAHDFLQLGLQCEVVVVTISESLNFDNSGRGFVDSMRRQGLSGSFACLPKNGHSVADSLLSHAVEIGADLIVCGAYGHSQTREMMIGGTTRHLFDHSHIPVLFSR